MELFILQDSELLVTFKMIAPLARVDRCTGRTYAHLHKQQSNLPESRKRFKRCQRLHTSDGDKAQSLAERVFEKRQGPDTLYAVPTLRSLCQVHRVFHVLTSGMRLFSTFVTGQIKMALSLRGPDNFARFKCLLWTWLLANHEYIYERNPQGPGHVADQHRSTVYDIYFPHVKGQTQRRNRLKFWIAHQLPNGDIRKQGVLQHFCHEKCCTGVKDFLRKLKWFVAVVCGEICKIFPRSRWTGMDESVDWIGVLCMIHNILPTIYALWIAKVTRRPAPPPVDASGGASDFAAILDDAPEVPGLAPDVGGHAHVDPAPAPELPDTPDTESLNVEQRMKTRNVAMRFVSVQSLCSICERMF